MKSLIIATLSYFIIINTQYYWGPIVGVLYPLVIILLLMTYIALTVGLIYQVIKSIKDKFRSKQRNILLICLIATLSLTLYKPWGLINFENMQGTDRFIAQREGAANCMTTLKLKSNSNFIESAFCFGPSRINGTYNIKKDTIWFTDYGEYKFGLISFNDEDEILELFKSLSDERPLQLFVTKNEL